MHNCAARDLELRHHMINGASVFRITAREDAARFAEAVLHEIDVMNVQVEQGSAGGSSLRKMFLSPGGWFRDAPEPRAQNFAVRSVGDRALQPSPLRPKTQAHRG